jgi:hypothetical protein
VGGGRRTRRGVGPPGLGPPPTCMGPGTTSYTGTTTVGHLCDSSIYHHAYLDVFTCGRRVLRIGHRGRSGRRLWCSIPSSCHSNCASGSRLPEYELGAPAPGTAVAGGVPAKGPTPMTSKMASTPLRPTRARSLRPDRTSPLRRRRTDVDVLCVRVPAPVRARVVWSTAGSAHRSSVICGDASERKERSEDFHHASCESVMPRASGGASSLGELIGGPRADAHTSYDAV